MYNMMKIKENIRSKCLTHITCNADKQNGGFLFVISLNENVVQVQRMKTVLIQKDKWRRGLNNEILESSFIINISEIIDHLIIAIILIKLPKLTQKQAFKKILMVIEL